MSDLDQVRGELRRMGYLDHGYERFLLQDAFRSQGSMRALLRLALRVGLLSGVILALALTLTLAAVNGNLSLSPFDLLPLFLHLFPILALTSGLAFLGLGGVLILVQRTLHLRRVETLSFATATLAAASIILALGWRGRDLLAASPGWQLGLIAVAVPLLAYALIQVVHHGLLGLTIRLSDAAPSGLLVARRWLGITVILAMLLLTLPALLAVRGGGEVAGLALPTAPGERVLLIGIDGVLPGELDYLLGRGELPAVSGLLKTGGALLPYARAEQSPAAFWTSVATGLSSPDHGVAALDSFRPLGLETPLARSGLLRAYWRRIAVPVGLADYLPVLSSRRRAYAFWELAARGGTPVLAVNWWSTYPAADTPGLTIAHGAYQLLAEGAPGAVSPEQRAPALAQQALAAEPSPALARWLAALPEGAQEELAETAVLPDAFYRQTFAAGLVAEPKAAALYLPALDIGADRWSAGDVAFSDWLRAELTATDSLLARSRTGFGTIAVVFDPGRRPGAEEGRLLIWRRAATCEPSPTQVDPRALTSSLIRALGLPQSAELPAPLPACNWPAPATEVDTYGQPEQESTPVDQGEDYLESLKALGYL